MDEFRLVREFGLGLFQVPNAKVQAWKRILLAEAAKDAQSKARQPMSKESLFQRIARSRKRATT